MFQKSFFPIDLLLINVNTLLLVIAILFIFPLMFKTNILYFTFLFSLFVFVSAAGEYFSILTGQYFSILTGPKILTGPDQYNDLFRILSELVFCLRYTITKTCRLTDLHVLSII